MDNFLSDQDLSKIAYADVHSHKTDAINFQLPSVLQWGSKMGATVGDGKDLAVKIGSYEKGKAIDLDGDKVTGGDVVRL